MLHDENYKRLFASKLMVEHLLRACLPDDLLAAADFSELDELSTEYVRDELRKRHGDTVWRLRLGRHWVYLLILLEFQSEDDPWMALRIHTYTGLLYQELVRNEAPGITDGAAAAGAAGRALQRHGAVDGGAADERAGRSGCIMAGAVSACAGLFPA